MEAWESRQVSARFAGAALEAAERGLESERSTLTASPRDLADPRVAAAAAVIGEMSALAAKTADAIGENDGAAARAGASALRSAERRLEAAR